jgi:hypothetical protein
LLGRRRTIFQTNPSICGTSPIEQALVRQWIQFQVTKISVVETDPDEERSKISHKNRIKLMNSLFDVLDVLF